MKIIKEKKEIDMKLTELTKALGSIENIESVSHCSTRMRIIIKDPKLVHLENLSNESYHNGVLLKENVVQIIIKNNIEEFNKSFLRSIGVSVSKVPNLFDVKLKVRKNFFKGLMDGISVIITPIVPYLITLGIVATITNVIGMVDTKNIGYIMFSTLLNGMVLGFSILIPWSIFKMMGGSQAIGICIGIVLCSSDLMNSNEFMTSGNKLFEWAGELFSFGNLKSGYPWRISFEGQILPLVGIAFGAVYLERLINKIKYGVLKQLLGIPLVTIVAYFFGLLVLAPLGMLVTYGMNIGVLWATTHDIAKYVFNPIMGLILPWSVVTGFGQIFVVINLQQFQAYGATTMMAMFTQLNLAVATSTFAFSLMNRKNQELQKSAIPGYLIAYVSGSTEPALFGVSLRFIFPVIAASIGAACGIIVTTASGVLCTMGTPSMLIFLSVIPNANSIPDFGMVTWAGTGFLWMAIAIGVTMATSFLATVFLSRISYFKNLTGSVLEKDFSPVINETINKTNTKI